MAKARPTIAKTVRYDPELITAAEEIDPNFSSVALAALAFYVAAWRAGGSALLEEERSTYGVDTLSAAKRSLDTLLRQQRERDTAPQTDPQSS